MGDGSIPSSSAIYLLHSPKGCDFTPPASLPVGFFICESHMIDYSTMKVGDTADLPHKSAWEGSNQDEYRRAQAYAASKVGDDELHPQFEVSQNMRADDPSKPIPIDQPGCGFTIKRVR